MSEVFKVGEIAIAHGMIHDTEYNGMECTILEGLHEQLIVHRVDGVGMRWVYFVEWEAGERATVTPQRLRKKHPPATDEATARQAMLECIERARLPIHCEAEGA